MGDKVLKIGTVHQCNCCLGSKTLHPLVSVIDLSKADLSAHTGIKFDFYTILLSECKCEAYMYGHQYYDFSDGTKDELDAFLACYLTVVVEVGVEVYHLLAGFLSFSIAQVQTRL